MKIKVNEAFRLNQADKEQADRVLADFLKDHELEKYDTCDDAIGAFGEWAEDRFSDYAWQAADLGELDSDKVDALVDALFNRAEKAIKPKFKAAHSSHK